MKGLRSAKLEVKLKENTQEDEVEEIRSLKVNWKKKSYDQRPSWKTRLNQGVFFMLCKVEVKLIFKIRI